MWICSIVRVSDAKHGKEETAKVKVNGMTPLLLALELKSSLYVKGGFRSEHLAFRNHC